jgi:hypothetical protein
MAVYRIASDLGAAAERCERNLVVMNIKFFAVVGSVLPLLTITVAGRPESLLVSQHIAPARPPTGPAHFGCRGYWVPDGVVTGPTAGYPYYGWYGYPYVPYICVHVRHRIYGKNRHGFL